MTKTIAARRKQTFPEELANSILHGTGALFSTAGLVLLVLRALGYIGGHAGGARAVAAFSLYAATLIILFLASTLYHALSGSAKKIFRILDHCAIYLLIAGTYTPVCTRLLPRDAGLAIIIAEWALAAAGIVLHVLNIRLLKKAEIAIYLLMGWAIVFAAPAIVRGISPAALILLAAGGLAFSAGVIFYKQHERRFFHVVWHVFVLAGAAFQWASIFIISAM
ncbi:MAG: hemolysin III family protein [Spirochaetaceae bacterium]|jgi:hemolysin III|nr:hemolysin III family protein [Spirochaetaceae bacterium]